jgi:hypothetical protein
MTPIDKVQIPQNSGFDPKRAMELANLIEVAYDEYEVWDFRQTEHLPEKLPPNEFICSPDFVDLSNTTVALSERIDPKKIPARDLPEKKPKDSYGELDQFWQTRTVKQYERLANLWAAEWWFLNLLNVPFLLRSFKEDLGELFEDVRNEEGLNNLRQIK